MLLVAGCASSPGAEVVQRSNPCEPDMKLVCTYRMGKPQKCSCQDNEGLREILEPEIYD